MDGVKEVQPEGKKKLDNKLQMEGRHGRDTFLRVLLVSVGASTRVCTMNHRARTGVYSEAWLSVSITPVWLSLPGPLSTQSCLNTHTRRQEAPHAKGKRTLYTRPWREHIMGLSGVWGLLVQSNTQTEATHTCASMHTYAHTHTNQFPSNTTFFFSV